MPSPNERLTGQWYEQVNVGWAAGWCLVSLHSFERSNTPPAAPQHSVKDMFAVHVLNGDSLSH